MGLDNDRVNGVDYDVIVDDNQDVKVDIDNEVDVLSTLMIVMLFIVIMVTDIDVNNCHDLCSLLCDGIV